MALPKLSSAKNLEDVRRNQRTVQRLGEVSARRAGNQRARISGVNTSGVAEAVRRRFDRTRQLANAGSDQNLALNKVNQLNRLEFLREEDSLRAKAQDKLFAFRDRSQKRAGQQALKTALISGVSGAAGSFLGR